MALKDHMSRQLVTIERHVPAIEAHRIMRNYWIRHLPVVDEAEEYIVGMLSERDLLMALSPDIQVEKLMSSPLKTFDIDTPARVVVDAMLADKISAYLITKKDEVVGIVTSEDMLALLEQMLKKEEGHGWAVSDILVNPALQRAAYLMGQAGI